MSEAEFQKKVTDLCDWLRLRWHHEVDSRRSKSGFPDLVIVGNQVLYAELKTGGGRVSPDQWAWIDALTRAGSPAYVWFPDDWDFIESRLRQLATTL